MATHKHSTARRRDVRRTIDGATPSWWQRLDGRQIGFSIALVLLLTLAGGTLAWTARQRLPHKVGEAVTAPIVSRVSFDSIDKAQTEARRQAARDGQPSVFRANEPYLNQIRQQLAGLIALATDETRVEQLSPEEVSGRHLDRDALAALAELVAEGKPTAQWDQMVAQFMDSLATLAILTPEDAQRERTETKAASIIIQPPNQQRETEKSDYTLNSTADPPETRRNNIDPLAARFPEALHGAVTAILMAEVEPTYLYDPLETEHRRTDAAEAVFDVIRSFAPNDILVALPTEELTTFSELDTKLLATERDAYWHALGNVRQSAQILGVFGIVLIMAIGLWAYFDAFYRRVTNKPMRGLVIVALLVGGQALAIGLDGFGPQFTYASAIFPTLLVTIGVTIAYDQRFALVVGGALAMLVALAIQLPMACLIVLVVGVTVAVSRLPDVRHRSKLVLVGLGAGAAMALTVFIAGGFERPLGVPGELSRIGRDALLALGTGFVAGLFVQGILPAIERIFKVTTALTLRELIYASNPLLRLIAEKAPGTYQHSLRIADMAEAAAESIGSSGLLCRVGAMFHDIGKVNKPMYFVENQAGGPNRHNKLSPAMSVLIIVGHVKDGIEMAREARLPPVVRHFIESHHGTTLVEYFYHAARKQGESDPDKASPSEFEFRYPGPKPQTKEAAIVMLCDAIEGAARVLAEPTPVRIEQLVHQQAIKRLMDGQFDQSNLTLAELHQIETSITKTLCAIYHGRIPYPREEDASAAPAPPQPAPAASG